MIEHVYSANYKQEKHKQILIDIILHSGLITKKRKNLTDFQYD